MASLIVFLRGEYRLVDRFVEELSAKYLPFTYQKHDGKDFIEGTKQEYTIPVSVRYLPLGAWEIVFPIEHTDLVLTTVLGKKGTNSSFEWINKYLWPLRKAMGLGRIPDYKDELKLPISDDGVHVIPIGFKKDEINASGNELL